MLIVRKDKGIALVTVMLIVALATVVATQMLGRVQLQMQRATNIAFNQQAYWYAMGVEAFTKRVLFTSFEDEPNKTSLEQIWAQGETTYPVEFGEITGEIFDLQACFNINALKSTGGGASAGSPPAPKSPAQQAFKKLLTSLEINDVSEFDAEYLADALTDWLDSDNSIASSGGAEDNDYAAKEFPYLAANNYIASVAELRLVEHFTVPIINAIKPYICVIPNESLYQLNINTISSEQAVILQAVLDLSSLDEAEDILSSRDEAGFSDIQEFYDLPEVKKLNLKTDQKKHLVVDSDYFQLKASTSFNDSFFNLTSVMKIENNNINVISRKIGRD